jgi:hypothetical protein
LFGATTTKTATSPLDAASVSPRPLLHQFTSVEEWLRAWVEFRRAQWPEDIRASYDRQVGTPCTLLAGSIGMDSAITVDGEVWVQFGTHDDDLDGWRPARRNERVALLITAQRRFPELAVLLPLRPAAATDCPACQGKGVHVSIAWCHDCSARGWLLPGLDTRLEFGAEPS